MKKNKITTLTINPSLDKSTHFSGLIAEQKIRCEKPRYDAGGGGINVSKAILKLGGNSLCIFTSGGSSGEMLEELITNQKIQSTIINHIFIQTIIIIELQKQHSFCAFN
jgi:6-phosphofructokinase 2